MIKIIFRVGVRKSKSGRINKYAKKIFSDGEYENLIYSLVVNRSLSMSQFLENLAIGNVGANVRN